ncbi:uncharacterized protein PV06_01842 [Exophiala oligosperma]|uniref:RTA1 domain-containing protein n=1 Tax=Exophiala oligosperma TaxID=215243 RepID=A0A0D2DUF3_9EURO|nr:uncharacterized protein PV06_01842 [Exophiala oligosperma]KIW46155.1 hypothetical protein PV06_01842 [Exophiala oligosperma]
MLQFRQQAAPTPTTSTPSTSGVVYFTSTEVITIKGGVTNSYVTIAPQTIHIAIPTCLQTITPDKNGYLPPGTCNALWDYYPSFGAALVFAALFGILVSVHICQAVAYKKKFCWVIIMAASWETIAFTFRTLSTRHQQNANIYLVFQIFILLAPLWVNAFDYMVLGRLIYFFTPGRSLFSIPASTLAAGFVSLDFVSFVIQLVGGSWASPTASEAKQMQGIHIYMGGIGLQQFFIFIFVGLAIKFQREMTKNEKIRQLHGATSAKEWRSLLYALYATLGLITVRIMFRLIQFSSGGTSSNNPLVSSEACFYILEAVPMVLALLCFNIKHPGSVLVGPESELPGLMATVKARWRKKQTVASVGEILQESDFHELPTRPHYASGLNASGRYERLN